MVETVMGDVEVIQCGGGCDGAGSMAEAVQ